MGVTCVAYNDEHQPIEEILRRIDRSGDFYTSGRLVAPMPRVEVEQAGMVSFPVPAVHIQALIRAAERAPYGRGPETILDRSVRDCWQIDSSQVQVGGSGWSDTFRSILKSVAGGLGCPGDRLEGQLYKLLVYETGGFFSEHRDTEKVTGMVGTLVISLPVAGSGGELMVRHSGRAITIDTCVSDPSELAYAAFYADCTHKTLPVRSGHRVSLVYNLILRGNRTEEFASAPLFSNLEEAVAGRLTRWARGNSSTRKIVRVLDHHYSSSGLTFDRLKGLDDTVAKVLAKASRKAQCSLYAAILHIEEYGSPDFDVYGYYDEDLDDVEMGEVYDWRCWLDGWVAADGTSPAFGRIPLKNGELLPADALDDAEPDEKRVREASGNEGIDIEQTYLIAALILWPRAKTVAVLAQQSLKGAIDFIEAETAGAAGVRDEGAEPAELVSHLIGAWPSTPHYGEESVPEVRSRFLRLLVALEDERGASRFLREIVLPRYAGGENEALTEAAVHFGPRILDGVLAELVEAKTALHVNCVTGLISRLCEVMPAATPKDWVDMLGEATRSLFRWLPKAFEEVEGPHPWQKAHRETVDADCIARILQIGWRFELDREATAAARLLAENPQTVTPDRDIPSALSLLRGDGSRQADKQAFWELWSASAEFLLQRSAVSPEEPTDWFVDARIDCECRLCQMLQAFCGDRLAKTKRFKMVQFDRDHLENKIKQLNLPMDRETIKIGRPYTLVCTKNRSVFRDRLHEYREDIKHMRKLIRCSGANVTGVEPRRLFQRLSAALLRAL